MRFKNISIVTSVFALFLTLVFYNYLIAQRALRDTRPSPLEISLISFPSSLKPSSRGTFVWQVTASPDLTASYTTIYWGNESSPSALTTLDSPEAVGYPNSLPDYRGRFALPSNFDEQILFEKQGSIYFRAYARVGSAHLWTPEERVTISQTP